MTPTRGLETTTNHNDNAMWLFTRYGFFSVTRSKEEPRKFQIRARQEHDLKELKYQAGIDAPILETPASDYRYRCIVTEEALRETMKIMIDDLTYSNFKDTVHDTPGQEDKAGPYMRIWSIMGTLQPGGPYAKRERFPATEAVNYRELDPFDPTWEWDSTREAQDEGTAHHIARDLFDNPEANQAAAKRNQARGEKIAKGKKKGTRK